MSLVDYAASSSEDEEEDAEMTNKEEEGMHREDDTPHATVATRDQRSISSSNRPSDRAPHLPTTSVQRLPDASLLLNSPAFSSHQTSGSDHYSRVAAAMAESASRKRESNGSVSSHQRSKHPRTNLRHSKDVPDTVGGLLVPPQLSGRSNVVTEDLGKLFARRNANPSLHRSPEQPS